MRIELKRHAPWLLALAVYALAPSVFAQTFVTPKGEAQNVRFEQREEGIVHILYDLSSSDPLAVFSVRVEASSDGGVTFGLRPQSAAGDVGNGVTPGVGKRIVWDAGKDIERVQFDRFRFRIVATGGPLQVAAAEPVGAAKEPVSTAKPAAADPPAQPATKQPVRPTPKKGGSGKWIAIAGGVGAAAAVAAASGGNPTPTPTVTPVVNTPTGPTTPPATMVGSWTGSIPSVPTVAFGGTPFCNYSITLSDVRVAFVVGSAFVVSNAVVTLTATERVEPSCPFPSVIPPNTHSYTLVSQQTSNTVVILTFQSAGSSAPSASLQLSGSFEAPNDPNPFIFARLTFHRTDQASPLDWLVTFTTNLAKSR